MQLQADLLGRPVIRSEIEEVGALGAASMVFAALGIKTAWNGKSTRFLPEMAPQERENIRRSWQHAIRQAKT